MKFTSDAGCWLDANGHKWNSPRQRKARAGKKRCGETPREIREGKRNIPTVKEFVRANVSFRGVECLFVPGSQRDVPAAVNHLGKTISAARYMALLKYGTPKSEGMFARHLCGNGHLSCVNPEHVAWGTPGDNIADANRHRKSERTGEQKTLV